MKRTALWAVALLAAVAFAIAEARASTVKRVALVIGNDQYESLPNLQKAVNDALSVGDTLEAMGFELVRGRNLSRQGIIDRLAEFTSKLQPGDTALVFYAGHGVAIGGANYLVPTDAPAVNDGAEGRVRGASLAESDIIAEIKARSPRVLVMILDACRNNPFASTATRTIGNTRGLGEVTVVRGVFTIYSAGIGQTALDSLEPDDQNPNSVFTRVFVGALARPGLHLVDLAVEVREQVAAIAQKAKNAKGDVSPHEQTPAYYDQTIGGRYYLAGPPPEKEDGEAVAAAPTLPMKSAERAWNAIKDVSSVALLEEFLRHYGGSFYGRFAEARLAELKKEEEAKRSQEEKKLEELRRIEEAKRLEEARRLEEAKKQEEAKKHEAMRRVDEAGRAASPPASQPGTDRQLPPTLLAAIGQTSRWAISNTANCKNPRMAYILALNAGEIIWRDGFGNMDYEFITVDGESEFRTTTRRSVHYSKKNVEVGQSWVYSHPVRNADRVERLRVTPVGKPEFSLARCP